MSTPRPSWTGAIRLGQLDIPVKLLPALEDTEIAFSTLHAADSGTLKQDKVCTSCARTVATTETVKGFEILKGQHVVITDHDLASAAPASRSIIVLDAFEDPHLVDPCLYEKPYYVIPDESESTDSYHLLVRALERSGLGGIGKVSFRTRERLAIIYSVPVAGEDKLILCTLRFADELRPLPAGVANPVDPEALKLALQIIDKRSRNVDLKKYADEYLRKLRAVIDVKRGAAAHRQVTPAQITRALKRGLPKASAAAAS